MLLIRTIVATAIAVAVTNACPAGCNNTPEDCIKVGCGAQSCSKGGNRGTQCVSLPTARGNGTTRSWEDFKLAFNKSYESALEEAGRRAVFESNMQEITNLGDPTLGVSKFSDWTDAEFSRLLGLRHSSTMQQPNERFWDGVSCPACTRFPDLASDHAHDSFDWTEHGAVTAVKDQHCGDCYAFSAAGDVEGSFFLAGNDLTSMSEEQIIDCCFEDMSILQCAACNGGEPHEVFTWLSTKVAGLCSDSTYPYTVGPPPHGHPSDCKRKLETNASVTARLSGWYWVSKGASGENNITKSLPKIGPVSIGIDATSAKMKQYTGGIAHPDCPTGSTLDHAVLIVGFGTENGVDYWKIKNSWGSDWGEDGYYRVVRGKNACGLAEDVTHSVIAGN